MSKSVALCGFASATREEVRKWENQVDEIWSLNMIHSSPTLREIYPLNITRLFDIHPFWLIQADWYSEAETDHWGWLTKEEHPYPIYLVEEHADIHNSIRYPVEEVSEKYLSRIWRGGHRVKYFTSTFCYMAALAIFEGFDDIRICGFEMGSETEYVYQKSGAEFWIGIMSQYADITLAENSKLVNSKLYGFEGGQIVTIDQVNEYHSYYLQKHDEALLMPKNMEQYIQVNLLNGAVSLCEELLRKNEMVSRQVLETYKRKFQKNSGKFAQEVNMLNAQGYERRRENDASGEELMRTAFEKLKFAYRYEGAMQVAMKLIAELDLQTPNKDLGTAYRFEKHTET